MAEPTLMDIIQLHERKWGERQYPGRPSLSTLMASRIVAMWKTGNRFVLSAHEDSEEVNTFVLAILTGKDSNPLDKKLLKLFVNHRLISFEIRIVAIESVPEPAKSANPNSNQSRFVFPKRSRVKGTPAVHPTEAKTFPDRDDVSLPGRNVSLMSGRHVELQPGREVPVIKTTSGTKNTKNK